MEIPYSATSFAQYQQREKDFCFVFKDKKYPCNRFYAQVLLHSHSDFSNFQLLSSKPRNKVKNEFIFDFDDKFNIFPKLLKYAAGEKLSFHLSTSEEINEFLKITEALKNQELSVSTYADDQEHLDVNNVVNSLIIDKNKFDNPHMKDNYQKIHIPYAAEHITEIKDQMIKYLRLDIIKDILNSENVTVDDEQQFLEIIIDIINEKGNAALDLIYLVDNSQITDHYRYISYLNKAKTTIVESSEEEIIQSKETEEKTEKIQISDAPIKTPLQLYCENPQNILFARIYSDSNQPINIQENMTIFDAISKQNEDLVYLINSIILSKPSVLEQKNSENDTPFAFAIRQNNQSAIEYFMNLISNVRIKLPVSFYPEALLGLAKTKLSFQSFNNFLDKLIEKDKSIFKYQDSRKRTFLSYFMENLFIEYSNDPKNDVKKVFDKIDEFKKQLYLSDVSGKDPLNYLIACQKVSQKQLLILKDILNQDKFLYQEHIAPIKNLAGMIAVYRKSTVSKESLK